MVTKTKIFKFIKISARITSQKGAFRHLLFFNVAFAHILYEKGKDIKLHCPKYFSKKKNICGKKAQHFINKCKIYKST